MKSLFVIIPVIVTLSSKGFVTLYNSVDTANLSPEIMPLVGFSMLIISIYCKRRMTKEKQIS